MNQLHWKAWVLMGSLVSAVLSTQPVAAQIIPDATLPAGERSQVTGNPNIQINGGAVRGSNLFHSFSEFSIPTGGSAFFNNAPTITNIFSRITGTSISNIDGLIRANGTANLFVLNPNGILFGPNASLNIGGSFVATTANAIGFPNGEVFSSDATQPLPSQPLNVNANALFFNQLAAQAIVNQSTANDRTGLQAPAGQSLLLVGGDVRLEGGQIVSPGSRVELGAVAGQGIVGLSETSGNWRLSFPDNVVRADVSLNNKSRVDVRAGAGGSIAITARNLLMNQGSLLQAGINSGLGFVGASAGDVTIDATGTVSLKDISVIVNYVDSGATGNAGNINILTGSLYLINGSQLFASTLGNGNAGKVNINARELVSFAGEGDAGFIVASGAFSSVGEEAVGNGSDINIKTGSLLVSGGAGLFASTFGKGNAGSVNIVARELVSLDGATSLGNATGAFSSVAQPGVGNAGDINIKTRSLSLTAGAGLFALTEGTGDAGDITIIAEVVNFSGVSEFGLASGAVTSTTDTANGQGGNITIDADTLSIRDGAVSSARAYNQWNGGNITINVNTLELTSGGKLLTTAYSSGQAGNSIINATDRITISGADPAFADRLARFGELIYPISASSGLFANTETNSTGQGGGIRITTGQLILQNSGQVAVNSRGLGSAGNVEVSARAITLDNQASISADTTGGGGNIDLRSPLILLRNRSNVSTNARGENIPGGNIGINTPFLIAVLNEDSNISANSENFRGGNVRINAFSIFGIQPSLVSTPLSDITATGATSALPGTIDVTTAGLDPTAGLVQLPTDVVDPGLIAQGCPANQGNSFVITGRGGLPPTPEQLLDDDAEWNDRRILTLAQAVDSGRGGHRDAGTRRHEESVTNALRVFPAPIIEANRWQTTPTGDVILVANVTSTGQNPFNLTSCTNLNSIQKPGF